MMHAAEPLFWWRMAWLYPVVRLLQHAPRLLCGRIFCVGSTTVSAGGSGACCIAPFSGESQCIDPPRAGVLTPAAVLLVARTFSFVRAAAVAARHSTVESSVGATGLQKCSENHAIRCGSSRQYPLHHPRASGPYDRRAPNTIPRARSVLS
eukprot:SAG11_NODE_1449_length_4885_cov_4.394066_6_plen_151_part_00